MNANELADLMIQFDSGRIWEHAEEIADILRQQQAEIEEWKRKYKDMHNLATQGMSRVHELEKAQEK
jgi:hypothetical protein